MKKKNNNKLPILIVVILIILLIPFLGSVIIKNNEDSSDLLLTYKDEEKLVIGTTKEIEIGNKALFDNAMHQEYISDDSTNLTGISYFKDETNSSLEGSKIDLEGLLYSSLHELDGNIHFSLPEVAITSNIYFEEVSYKEIYLEFIGIDYITLIGVNEAEERVTKEYQFNAYEKNVLTAFDFGYNVSGIELDMLSCNVVGEVDGYIKSGIISESAIYVDIYSNNNLVEELKYSSSNSLLFEDKDIPGCVFIDISKTVLKYTEEQTIDEWLDSSINYINVRTEVSLIPYTSNNISIDESGLWLVNLPSIDGDIPQVEHSSYIIEVEGG